MNTILLSTALHESFCKQREW